MIRLAAILSGSDFTNRRGLMNAALSRIEHLEKFPEFKIDIFALRTEKKEFTLRELIKGQHRVTEYDFNGRKVHILHKIEFISHRRILRRPLRWYNKKYGYRLQDWEWQKHFATFIRGFDAITAHFNDAAFIAKAVHDKDGTPYFVTWHGSDIHTIPFIDPVAKEKTISAIKNAACNFFVSKALLQTSIMLTPEGRKEVLYNGADESFTRFPEEKRRGIRQRLGVPEAKVVTFAGALRSIKNADILPEIFYHIQERVNEPIQFWIIGSGELQPIIEGKLSATRLIFKFWGSQPSERMPEFFNSTDVLVVPSKNEGFSLVALEALTCGANVVGASVGGIPEVIGEGQTVEPGEDFVDRFAAKVAELLYHPIKQNAPINATWSATADKERAIYHEFIDD